MKKLLFFLGKSIQVTIILRDETGKYVWTSNLNYDSKPYILPQLDDKIRNIHESVGNLFVKMMNINPNFRRRNSR